MSRTARGACDRPYCLEGRLLIMATFGKSTIAARPGPLVHARVLLLLESGYACDLASKNSTSVGTCNFEERGLVE